MASAPATIGVDMLVPAVEKAHVATWFRGMCVEDVISYRYWLMATVAQVAMLGKYHLSAIAPWPEEIYAVCLVSADSIPRRNSGKALTVVDVKFACLFATVTRGSCGDNHITRCYHLRKRRNETTRARNIT